MGPKMLNTKRSGFRPELIVLLLLVVAVPLIGWQIYRKITFKFEELITALTSHPCAYVHRDKTEFDLTKLSKSRSTCSSTDASSCLDYHLRREDSDFYFNVCNNVMRKPSQCNDLFGRQNVQSSIGYQVGDGVCYYMGQLRTGRWSLLDQRHPEVGLRLLYTGGSRCGRNRERSTEFHFECNRKAGKGGPVAIFGDCEFVVTWETELACPIRQITLFHFLLLLILLVIFYLAAGFFFNVRYRGAIPDYDAIPHIQQIRWLGAVILAVFVKVLEIIGDYLPGVRGAVGWLADKVGMGYELIAERMGGRAAGEQRKSAGQRRTTGILDREGYDQL